MHHWCGHANNLKLCKPRKFKPQVRLEPAQQHWWQARKADVLTVTPRVPLDLIF